MIENRTREKLAIYGSFARDFDKISQFNNALISTMLQELAITPEQFRDLCIKAMDAFLEDRGGLVRARGSNG